MAQNDQGRGNDVSVVVASPSNESREFVVDPHERVDKLARTAVKKFVELHLMTDEACSLALVVDGVATLLDDAARLEDVGVTAGVRLVLVVKKPKTDG